MKKAIIACKALYPEIINLIQDLDNIRLEFLPQKLHNLADSMKMRNKIQEKIDQLEEDNNYDYIILGYGLCSKGVEGLKAEKATLVIAIVHDCIPLLINKDKYKDIINSERTYFLSKGWIEYGGDLYKEFLSMTDQLDRLINYFNNYNTKSEADWYDKERYSCSKKYDNKTAKWITYECIKNYEMIALIDNGKLSTFHYQYLEEQYYFLEELFKEYNQNGLENIILEGDISILKDLIFFGENMKHNKNYNKLLIIEPGDSIKLENKLLNIN